MNYRISAATIALALLSACQAKEEPIAIDSGNNAAESNVETLPPGDGNEVANAVGGGEADKAALIPAQYHGRWGMGANDCDPGRDDNKGLITIDPMTLRFYEATATLTELRPAIATSFSGNFRFSGEGMNWEKVETLTVNGNTLIREDKDGAFTYQRCA